MILKHVPCMHNRSFLIAWIHFVVGFVPIFTNIINSAERFPIIANGREIKYIRKKKEKKLKINNRLPQDLIFYLKCHSHCVLKLYMCPYHTEQSTIATDKSGFIPIKTLSFIHLITD